MNFNSAEFLVFLPIVLIAFAILSRFEKARDLLLLAASYTFYMSWRWEYLGIILFSTIIDYIVGLSLGRTQGKAMRRLLLVTSLVVNLGFLFYFKYLNFFIEEASHVGFGETLSLSRWNHSWLLPVGISFYTFQTMSYSIDVYRRVIPPERNLVKFAVFVSFFPQLVAGPIVRAKEFLPQLHQKTAVSRSDFNSGLALIFQGLFKKIIIADLLATLVVDEVFANPESFSSVELLLALYGYAFQIYNDFSGYSDIAIGTAKLFGFDFPVNFRRPYMADGIRDFWARWHISLSTWIRDYLYIPLGGNRRGDLRTLVNLLLTMTLAGLWHGAALNFAFWGIYHGLLLVIAFFIGKYKRSFLPKWVSILFCFHLVLLGWLLFRIRDMSSLEQYLSGIMEFSSGWRFPGLYLFVLLFAVIAHVVPVSVVEKIRAWTAASPSPVQGVIYGILLIVFCACTLESPTFIYFQF